MEDFAFCSQVHQALARAASEATNPAQRAHLQKLSVEALARGRAASRVRPDVVFDLASAPGYVLYGRPGDVRSAPDPELGGLRYAWTIFLHGAGAGDVLSAVDMLGFKAARPGNSLRNALEDAASWMEPRCHELACAFRRPVIVVSSDGSLRHDPDVGPCIHLRASWDVREVCSS